MTEERVRVPREQKKTRIQVIHEEWEAAGAKMPSKKDTQALLKKMEDSLKAVEVAEANLETLRADVKATTLELMQAFGTRAPVKLNGKVYDAACHKASVFYKQRNAKDEAIIGG